MTRSLGRWWVFWLAVAGPLLAAMFLAFVVAFEGSGLYLDISRDGMSFAYSAFKVPLLVSALSFPLGALAASIHRSAQTQRQIMLTEEQNLFSNFLKHREEFLKVLVQLESSYNISFKAPTGLYQTLFPENTYHNLRMHLSGDALALIEKFYSDIRAIYSRLRSLCDDRRFDEKTIRRFYAQLFECGSFLEFVFEEKAEAKSLYWAADGSWHVAFSSSDVMKHTSILLGIVSTIAYFGNYPNSKFFETFTPDNEFQVTARKVFSEETAKTYRTVVAFYPEHSDDDSTAS